MRFLDIVSFLIIRHHDDTILMIDIISFWIIRFFKVKTKTTIDFWRMVIWYYSIQQYAVISIQFEKTLCNELLIRFSTAELSMSFDVMILEADALHLLQNVRPSLRRHFSTSSLRFVCLPIFQASESSGRVERALQSLQIQRIDNSLCETITMPSAQSCMECPANLSSRPYLAAVYGMHTHVSSAIR